MRRYKMVEAETGNPVYPRDWTEYFFGGWRNDATLDEVLDSVERFYCCDPAINVVDTNGRILAKKTGTTLYLWQDGRWVEREKAVRS